MTPKPDADRIAVVTGASRGLGKAISLALAGTGMRMVLVARDGAALAETAAECRHAGARDVLTQPADLSAASAAQGVADAAVRAFGRIDVLVNVAGDTRRGAFLEMTDDDHLSGFLLKYHGAVRLCRACWPALENARGCIVNVSGVGAMTPEAEFTIGGPVNAALINLSKALSRVAPDRVRVNSLCPGHIVTDRLQRRIDVLARDEHIDGAEARELLRQRLGIDRFGQPQDIATAVRFLCSDEAGYITGTNLTVDGGATPGI